MDVTPEQLFQEIGRLQVTNGILTAQLAASRRQLLETAQALADAKAENEPEEIPDTD